jgi:hypothetical protein
VGPRAGLNAVVKRRIPRPCSPQPIAQRNVPPPSSGSRITDSSSVRDPVSRFILVFGRKSVVILVGLPAILNGYLHFTIFVSSWTILRRMEG